MKKARMRVEMRCIRIRTKDSLLLPSLLSLFLLLSPQGTCESEGAAPGTGPAGGVVVEEGGRRALTTDRSLYNLPTFVAPMQGGMKISKCYGWQGA